MMPGIRTITPPAGMVAVSRTAAARTVVSVITRRTGIGTVLGRAVPPSGESRSAVGASAARNTGCSPPEKVSVESA